MPRTSKTTRSTIRRSKAQPAKSPGQDWSAAVRNPYAAALAGCRWRVVLDPDLVDLLSGCGGPHAHLAAFATRRATGERSVVVLRMNDEEIRPIRRVLERIGATIESVPPHPHVRAMRAVAKPRRRAG